jgi:hypothetical protein
MLTRLLAIAVLLAACAAVPASSTLKVESVPGHPPLVRLLLDAEESFRLSRSGVMDPASPSGLTDRFRYRAAIEGYVATVVKEKALCPDGYEIRDIEGGEHGTVITIACLAP